MASAFDRIPVGSNLLPNTSFDVIHCVLDPTVAYGRIPTQNHRVETLGGGEFLDG